MRLKFYNFRQKWRFFFDRNIFCSTFALSKKRTDSVAQLVEHIPFKDGVLGSSPSWITKATGRLPFLFGIKLEPSALQSGSFAVMTHRVITLRSHRFEPQLDHMAAGRLPFLFCKKQRSSRQDDPYDLNAVKVILKAPVSAC